MHRSIVSPGRAERGAGLRVAGGVVSPSPTTAPTSNARAAVPAANIFALWLTDTSLADEAGNFDFSGARGASRYFILTSVTVADCSVGEQLLALRRDLGWRGLLLDRPWNRRGRHPKTPAAKKSFGPPYS